MPLKDKIKPICDDVLYKLIVMALAKAQERGVAYGICWHWEICAQRQFDSVCDDYAESEHEALQEACDRFGRTFIKQFGPDLRDQARTFLNDAIGDLDTSEIFEAAIAT